MPSSRPTRNTLQRSRQIKNAPSTLPSLPAEAALSFLKDSKGALTWSVRDLADSLKISPGDAPAVIAFLQAQGYVKPAHGTDEWVTTPAGEAVSGAKAPRFTRESVEHARATLRDRIQQVNKDRNVPFRIIDAVAFGDFLIADRARTQAADVGIRLMPRNRSEEQPNRPRTATEADEERRFLQQLRGGSPLLNIRPYAEWMRKRSHVDLL